MWVVPHETRGSKRPETVPAVRGRLPRQPPKQGVTPQSASQNEQGPRSDHAPESSCCVPSGGVRAEASAPFSFDSLRQINKVALVPL